MGKNCSEPHKVNSKIIPYGLIRSPLPRLFELGKLCYSMHSDKFDSCDLEAGCGEGKGVKWINYELLTYF